MVVEAKIKFTIFYMGLCNNSIKLIKQTKKCRGDYTVY